MPTSQGGYDQSCVALVLLTADFTEIKDENIFGNIYLFTLYAKPQTSIK
jgi:hypothetical protein